MLSQRRRHLTNTKPSLGKPSNITEHDLRFCVGSEQAVFCSQTCVIAVEMILEI